MGSYTILGLVRSQVAYKYLTKQLLFEPPHCDCYEELSARHHLISDNITHFERRYL